MMLKIYNPVGQEIETLVNGFQTPGEHEVIWQSKELPVGTYFCRLQTSDYNETKILIVKK